MNILRMFIVVFAALHLAGCYITGMKLENQTGHTIRVYSDHTKTTTVIRDGSMKAFPHSCGLVTISVTNGPVWNYPNFSWFAERTVRYRYVKNHPILFKGTRGFLIDTNGCVFALLPAFIGWNHADFRNTQPNGFPLDPNATERANLRRREQPAAPIMPPRLELPVSTWEPPAWWNGTDGLTCRVHNVTRIQETVPIVYGLLVNDDPEFAKAEEKEFPNSWHYVGGGCCVESPKTEIIRYCPECRRIEAEWIKRQKDRHEPAHDACEPYVVRKGDTLYSIARKFKDSDTFAELVSRNRIHNPDKIAVGQILYVQNRNYSESLNQALESKDYKTADEIMTKLNTDFPGGPFRDSFLLKWAAVKIKRGQLENAKALLQELITDYPESAEVGKARKMILPLTGRDS